ncbi:hypothetical protein [Ruegeria arenilitoris]|uniref:hypothetical protein n=1 Tax=Ruegeria arenilitoris TaxID=1173585 RepID=UPI00147D2066|nr:hypothetical protein [Ruegeria arenilitoris]
MSVFDDPIQKAIYEALVAAGAARDAVYEATSRSTCPKRLQAAALRFERLRDDDLFKDTAFDEVSAFEQMLNTCVAAESQSGYVADEHCMSGGGYEVTHLSEDGQRFEAARRSVAAMVAALQGVSRHLHAERLSVSLRG